jgi:FtsH-binding integral membrane protein
MSTITSSYQEYDQGLRNFMLNMYNHTAAGLALSGIVAYLTYASGLIYTLMTGPLAWVVMLAPLGMIFWYSFAGQNWTLSKIKNFYYAFTVVMGIGLSTLFAVYTAYSLTQVFFITSATFAGASIYGYSTKKDLTSMGSFLIIGLIGIIIASIVNIFMASSGLSFVISIAGVLIFTGLTAWDTQRAKEIYYSHGGDERFGVQFALSLYLNFINLFQMLLSLFGNRE